jgi:hypothetical protein
LAPHIEIFEHLLQNKKQFQTKQLESIYQGSNLASVKRANHDPLQTSLMFQSIRVPNNKINYSTRPKQQMLTNLFMPGVANIQDDLQDIDDDTFFVKRKSK